MIFSDLPQFFSAFETLFKEKWISKSTFSERKILIIILKKYKIYKNNYQIKTKWIKNYKRMLIKYNWIFCEINDAKCKSFLFLHICQFHQFFTSQVMKIMKIGWKREINEKKHVFVHIWEKYFCFWTSDIMKKK